MDTVNRNWFIEDSSYFIARKEKEQRSDNVVIWTSEKMASAL